jgi:hypothetical protein
MSYDGEYKSSIRKEYWMLGALEGRGYDRHSVKEGLADGRYTFVLGGRYK